MEQVDDEPRWGELGPCGKDVGTMPLEPPHPALSFPESVNGLGEAQMLSYRQASWPSVFLCKLLMLPLLISRRILASSRDWAKQTHSQHWTPTHHVTPLVESPPSWDGLSCLQNEASLILRYKWDLLSSGTGRFHSGRWRLGSPTVGLGIPSVAYLGVLEGVGEQVYPVWHHLHSSGKNLCSRGAQGLMLHSSYHCPECPVCVAVPPPSPPPVWTLPPTPLSMLPSCPGPLRRMEAPFPSPVLTERLPRELSTVCHNTPVGKYNYWKAGCGPGSVSFVTFRASPL